MAIPEATHSPTPPATSKHRLNYTLYIASEDADALQRALTEMLSSPDFSLPAKAALLSLSIQLMRALKYAEPRHV